jgi:nicotinamidase-related amidase
MDPSWRRGAAASAVDADTRLSALARGVHAVGGLVVAVTTLPARLAVRSRWADAAPAHEADTHVDADVTLSAGGVDAFFASALDETLRSNGRRDVIIAGWGLEGPVHSTLRTANDRGYECVLVPDASTSLDESLVPAAQSMVEFSGGIFGAIATTDEVLDLCTRSTRTLHISD